jgi:hypothetical protein
MPVACLLALLVLVGDPLAAEPAFAEDEHHHHEADESEHRHEGDASLVPS